MVGKRFRTLAIGAAATALLLPLAACGSGSSGDSGSQSSAKGEAIKFGTTDKVTSLDPAAAYDLGSWTLMYNIYQTLLTIPAGKNTPEGDAAESCAYKDPKTFTCTLKPNLKFSNGDALTSSDVKFSIDRNLKIKDPNGASGLLASVKSVEAPDDATVVFHLKKPDTTFQFILTTNASAIVDEDVFAADKKLADDKVIGSGSYKLDQYKANDSAILSANDNYQGDKKAKAPRIFVSYYPESAQLKQASQRGEVDIAWRSLSPTDINDLKKDDKVTVAEGAGAEIRYWVWKVDGPVGKKEAIRKAAAYLIDRPAIVKNAYDGTVDPLYSIVAPGFPGQIPAFKDAYGASPDKAKAAKVLKDAGISTPVKLTIGYTPSHYGPNAVDEATQVQRQLDGSGLFKVSVKSSEWTQYQDLYKQDAYDMYMLGWFPDFLDADNYLQPFMVNGGFYANGYKSKEANKLVAHEEASSDQSVRQADFKKLQKLAAADVPFIPTWVGKNVAVYGSGVKGVEDTLDPSFIFRFWAVSKG